MDDHGHIEQQLARLADGSLPEGEAARLRARVDASSELQERLRAQEHAVSLVHMTETATAPLALRAALRAQVASGAVPSRARRRGWARPWVLAPLTGAAVAAVAVVVVLVASGARSLTVTRTARLALAAPTRGAPPVDRSNPDLLSLRVDSIPFPAYAGRGDGLASGARSDEIDDRRVQTVFYELAGSRIGYSIVAAAALPVPRGHAQRVDGVTYVTGAIGSAGFVTWRRDGHTCVIAGRGVTAHALLRLADATQITT